MEEVIDAVCRAASIPAVRKAAGSCISAGTHAASPSCGAGLHPPGQGRRRTISRQDTCSSFPLPSVFTESLEPLQAIYHDNLSAGLRFDEDSFLPIQTRSGAPRGSGFPDSAAVPDDGILLVGLAFCLYQHSHGGFQPVLSGVHLPAAALSEAADHGRLSCSASFLAYASACVVLLIRVYTGTYGFPSGNSFSKSLTAIRRKIRTGRRLMKIGLKMKIRNFLFLSPVLPASCSPPELGDPVYAFFRPAYHSGGVHGKLYGIHFLRDPDELLPSRLPAEQRLSSADDQPRALRNMPDALCRVRCRGKSALQAAYLTDCSTGPPRFP